MTGLTKLMAAYSRVPTFATATDEEDLIKELIGVVDGFKFGLATFTARYPNRRIYVADVFRYQIHRQSKGKSPVFMDWKFNDIPATTEQAVHNVAHTPGVSMVSVHTTDIEALEAGLRAVGGTKVDIVAVTVLTSIDDQRSYEVFDKSAARKVLEFAKDARSIGVPAITCSPQELKLLSDAGLVGPGAMYTIVPGIRPEWWRGEDDQKRTMTPAQAARAGADWVVLDRPIFNAPENMSPIAAAKLVQEELRTA